MKKNILEALEICEETDKAYMDRFSDRQIMLHCVEEMGECLSLLSKYVRATDPNGIPSNTSPEDILKEAKKELADSVSVGIMLAVKLGILDEIIDIHVKKSIDFMERM